MILLPEGWDDPKLYRVQVSPGSSLNALIDAVINPGRLLACGEYILTTDFVLWLHHFAWHQQIRDETGVKANEILCSGHVRVIRGEAQGWTRSGDVLTWADEQARQVGPNGFYLPQTTSYLPTGYKIVDAILRDWYTINVKPAFLPGFSGAYFRDDP